MKEKIRKFLNEIPDWAKSVAVSAVIIAVATIVNNVVRAYIDRNVFEIVQDDFSHVFQIDSMENTDEELILTGWVFECGKDAEKKDFDIILYNYNENIKYYMDVEDVVREDINDYFLCEYDYFNVGFKAKIKSSKVDLKEANYEILIRPRNVRKAYKSGIYLSENEIMYAKPESYVPLDIEGTEIEKIVSDGVLRTYRPDVGMYVYQYENRLYWIADENYKFMDNGKTHIQYQLNTTQIDKLPQYRLENEWYWDNIIFYFEDNEIMEMRHGKYRVAVADIPSNYSIREIWTGYYLDEWKWIQYFRPYYKFG